MAYVIIDSCTKDEHCIDSCPVNGIQPTKDETDLGTVPQLYVNLTECIDCGGCMPICPTGSIYTTDDIPEEYKHFIEKNAARFN
jgi:ferredoxin